MTKALGDYTILKEIGSGPLGQLFLGEHRFLKKPFVLKVLPDDLSSDRGFMKRLEEVALDLAKLEHPHIAKVHNISFSEGKYFLVTDFIADPCKETLGDYLRSHPGRFSEEELLALSLQIVSALDYLHAKKLFHGSLKLSSVLLSEQGGNLSLCLTDVGLARLFGQGPLLHRQLSSQNQASSELGFLHNFSHLSPEQKSAGTHDMIKADVYAFGVLLYYLIMRHYPEGFFPLPSQVAPEYKLLWDHFIIQCLQPDPAKRPHSLHVAFDELVHNKQAALPKSDGPLKPKINPQELQRPEFEVDPGAIFQKEYTVAKFRPKPAEIKNHEPIQTEMVVIKGGSFPRGSNNGGRDELPRHVVTLSSFAIDIHPVINEQFVRFLDAMGGEKDAQNIDIIRLRESRIKRSGGRLSIESGYAKHPVVGVTWYGAIAYAKWVGKRLPTEAEWEVAAGGSLDEAIYPTGNNIERSQANFFSSDTTTVMSYPCNSYGLYDTAGNVYEWCQDWYGYHYYDESVQEPNDPQGPPQGVYRVLRGGCWKSLKEDLRCAHRHRNNPGTVNKTYGFRCAADVV